jgi:hypothetical protein
MSPQAARKRLLSALDMHAIRRLSERLNPDYATRAVLEAEICAVWPSRKVRDEIETLLQRSN